MDCFHGRFILFGGKLPSFDAQKTAIAKLCLFCPRTEVACLVVTYMACLVLRDGCSSEGIMQERSWFILFYIR